METFFETPESENGLGMELWRSPLILTDQGYEDANIVYSPNGGLAQFYIRSSSDVEDENRSWQQPPLTRDVLRVASQLYREAIGHDTSILGANYMGQQIYSDLSAPATEAATVFRAGPCANSGLWA